MKPIPGYNGYLASSDGRIFSNRSGDVIELKRRLCRGYFVVTIAEGKPKRRNKATVHRMVLLAYAGLPPEGKLLGRHLNGNSQDNRISNLAWGDAKDNAADAVRHGMIGPGELAHRRKLSKAQVIDIVDRIGKGEPTAKLAQEYKVSRYYPSSLAKGKNWTEVVTSHRGGLTSSQGWPI